MGNDLKIILLSGLLTLGLSACAGLETSSRASPIAGKLPSDSAVGAATFDPQGRLWRVLIAGSYVYVDYSDDYGKHYNGPVRVNQGPQRIVANPEDRPAIAVDPQGRVAVLYPVMGPQGLSPYFSYSSDGGKRFSTPVPISSHADQTKQIQSTMANDPNGRVYIFWNDEQGTDSAAEQSAALYLASPERLDVPAFVGQKLKDGMCNCCRLAVDFDTDGRAVVFGRFVFEGGIRDHGMLKAGPNGIIDMPWRVTDDEWQIDACPVHGPALSIAADGRYHIAWFTQGDRRQGLFYARSDDRGKHFSPPMAFGDPEGLAEHPDVLALGQRVVLVWKEFDGEVSRIKFIESRNRGEHWSAPLTLASTVSAADYPFLITDGKGIFLSWNNVENGYQLIPVP